MAIDIRATVTCSLGTLISGSISDDYIQGSGLVKTRGSVEISGTITPDIGTVVTFSYTKDGVVSSIPRKLRVMSSFADPFRRTTTVELGCKLTYLSDYRPAPTVDGEPPVETGKRQQCLNGYVDYPVNSIYGVPISAAGLLTTCCERLGITASSNPLTNKFFRDSFDFSPGYVSVLNDLLVSESYFGYLDINEVLQIVNLDQVGGSGPVYTSNDIVDLGPVGVGQLPGDAVVVRYDSLRLKEDLEEEAEEDIQVISQRNWEEDEVVGSKEVAEVRYTGQDGNTYSNFYSYIPYTKTISVYGEDDSWDDTSCVISGREGADLSNTVVKRTTTKNVIKAAVATDYCAQLLAEGIGPDGGYEDVVTTVETYEYNLEGQIIKKTTEIYEPDFMWAGRLNVQFVYSLDDGGTEYVNFEGANSVLVSKTVEVTTTLYAALPTYVYLDPGETARRLVNGQKVVTTTYENFAIKQFGQQTVSGANQNASFASAPECALYLADVARTLVLTGTTIQTSNNRILVGVEKRPPVELRMGLNGDNFRGEYKSELNYISGSLLGKRIIELSMPLQSDDYYDANGKIIKGDAPAKANRYGRVQNRLLLGNRNGVNLQLAPEKLPAAPYSPLYLQASGLTALYRANGTNWAFDSNGIVCSVDALFWGAVSGTGTFWFPVAPGITTLPAEPPIVDGAMNANTIVLPYNETAIYDAVVSTTVTVTKFDYSLTLLTEIPIFVLTTQVEVRPIRRVESPLATIALAALTPTASGGGAIRPPAAPITIASYVPVVSGGGSVIVPAASSIYINSIVPDSVGTLQTIVSLGAPIDLTLSGVAPAVYSGASLAVPAGPITVTGTAPGINPFVQTGTAAPVLGNAAATSTTGWTTLVSSYADDANTQTASFGFTFTLNSTGYTTGYVGSNGYITFGAGSNNNSFSLGQNNPSENKIMFLAGDRSYQKVYTKAGSYSGTDYFGVRWEGRKDYGDAPESDCFTEIYIYKVRATKQYVEVRYGNLSADAIYGDGFDTGWPSPALMIANSSTAYAQSTWAANSSWVFEGNSTGTSWTLTQNRFILV